MKLVLKIVLPLILVICIGIGIYIYIDSNRVIYNDDNATGNTAGNLLNGGLFCEYSGKIYFANPYDNNKLYVMNSDCSDAKKINNDSVASLNVCGKYIYYVRNNFSSDSIGMIFRGHLNGVYRCDLDGGHVKALYDKPSGTISLAGNNLYYQHYDNKTALTLWKIKIDGEDDTKISDTEYNPSCIQNGKMYFSDLGGRHNILSLDTKNDKITTYYDANTYLADVENGYTYYIDLSKNYSLVRFNNSTKTLELLYSPEDGKVVNYNVYGNKVFIQVEAKVGSGLYRMNVDGTQIEHLASGNLTNIHCTSQYTFFQYYNDQGTLYRVPTTSPTIKVEQITIKPEQ